MIAVLQRVTEASVSVDGELRGACGAGLTVLLCAVTDDTDADARTLASKLARLRIFSDAAGKMNLSLADIGGSALVVPNFTLAADCRHGNRPDFFGAAHPVEANRLFRLFVDELAAFPGISGVETGVFGADMQLSLINDGPVTVILDSRHIGGKK